MGDIAQQRDNQCNQPSDWFLYRYTLQHKSLQDHLPCPQELNSCCHTRHRLNLLCMFVFLDRPVLDRQRKLHRHRHFDALEPNLHSIDH